MVCSMARSPLQDLNFETSVQIANGSEKTENMFSDIIVHRSVKSVINQSEKRGKRYPISKEANESEASN